MTPQTLAVAASTISASKIYGSGEDAVYALNDVSVEFYEGQFTAIMGPSGSGKSTLMHCIAGLDELTKGSAIIDGVDLSTMKDKGLTELRREKIGFVFQSFNLVPTLTANENIRLPLMLGNDKGDEAWIQNVINTVHLQDRLTHRPSELSGGQQQMLALAKAVMLEPQLLCIDELSLGLAPVVVQDILQIVERLKDQGITMIIVEQSLNVALAIADRAVFMERGQVMFEGPAKDLLERDDLLRAVFLSGEGA